MWVYIGIFKNPNVETSGLNKFRTSNQILAIANLNKTNYKKKHLLV